MAVQIKTNPKLAHLSPERIKSRGDVPMTGGEVLDEFEFLLNAGTHPLLAAQMLGIPYDNLHKMASNHGRSELFTRVDISAWNKYRHDRMNQYGRVA